MFRRAQKDKTPPVKCRTCGAENRPDSDLCWRCELPLAPPEAKPVPKDAHKFCSLATPFPPPGKRIQAHEMWCTLLDKPVPADDSGPKECFSLAFTWKPTEALD